MKLYQNSEARAYRDETKQIETKRNQNGAKRNETKTTETEKSNKIEQNEIKFKMLNINYYGLLKHII